jgi:hypothetical protein
MTSEIAEFFAARPTEGLTSWLLASFGSDSFEPVQLDDRPGPAIQIQYAFEASEPAVQERLKEAVAAALLEWSPRAHGVRVLKPLAAVAAYIRASRAAPALRMILEDILLERARQHQDDVAWHQTTGFVVATLHGFAPMAEVAQAFERWLYERTDPRYYGQFFIGLCACRPHEFVQHVPRIMTLADQHPASVAVPTLISALVQTVGLRGIATALPALPREVQGRFLDWVSTGDDSPAELHLDPLKGHYLVARHPVDDEPVFHPVEWKVARAVETGRITSAVAFAERELGDSLQWH